MSPGPSRFRAWMQLARPANIVTAWADIGAGFAIAGGFSAFPAHTDALFGLLLSTTGLYGGGVVLNDVFDAELDARERPERPIPSGRIRRNAAAGVGVALLLGGVVAAATVSFTAGGLALFIALSAVGYNAFGKHRPLIGPLNMGLCRGGNLLLGLGASPSLLVPNLPLALLPILYIAAITAMSRGEVAHEGSRAALYLAVVLATVVVGVLGVLVYQAVLASPAAGLFPFVFAALVLPPFLRAARHADPNRIRSAVRAGVLGLIPLNATLAAAFAGAPVGWAILALLPLSLLLARAFAVT